jgi:hypothetical protein
MRVDQAVDKLALMYYAVMNDILAGGPSHINVRFNGHDLHAFRANTKGRGMHVRWKVDGHERETLAGIIVECVKPVRALWRKSGGEGYWRN